MAENYEELRLARIASLDPVRRAQYENRRPPLRQMSVADMRSRNASLQGPPTPDPNVPYYDVSIPGPNGPVPTRIYNPKGGAEPKGIYIHIHAGGYIMLGGLDTLINQNTSIARETGCIVVAPDFRLPPEHTFPAGLNDCWAVAEWVGSNAGQIGGDPDRIGIGGACTGGSFAAALALMARDAGAPKIAAQYLAATVFDCRCDYKSHFENGHGYTLSHDDDAYVIEVYLKDMEHRWDWRASPILAPSVRCVAPAYIYVGEWDVLRDESKAYADRLRDAGVDVTLRIFPQESHQVSAVTTPIMRSEMYEFLRRHLSPSSTVPKPSTS